MTNLPTPELIAIIERTLDAQQPGGRIEWPFHPVAGEAGAQDAVRELIRRVKDKAEAKFTGGGMCRRCGKNPKFEGMAICRPCFDWLEHRQR